VNNQAEIQSNGRDDSTRGALGTVADGDAVTNRSLDGCEVVRGQPQSQQVSAPQGFGVVFGGPWGVVRMASQLDLSTDLDLYHVLDGIDGVNAYPRSPLTARDVVNVTARGDASEPGTGAGPWSLPTG